MGTSVWYIFQHSISSLCYRQGRAMLSALWIPLNTFRIILQHTEGQEQACSLNAMWNMKVLTYNKKPQKSAKPLHRMVCVALRQPQISCFKFLAISSLSSLCWPSFTTLRAAIVMWKMLHPGCSLSIPVSGFEAELTCISASKLWICTPGLAWQYPSMGRLWCPQAVSLPHLVSLVPHNLQRGW